MCLFVLMAVTLFVFVGWISTWTSVSLHLVVEKKLVNFKSWVKYTILLFVYSVTVLGWIWLVEQGVLSYVNNFGIVALIYFNIYSTSNHSALESRKVRSF